MNASAPHKRPTEAASARKARGRPTICLSLGATTLAKLDALVEAGKHRGRGEALAWLLAWYSAKRVDG